MDKVLLIGRKGLSFYYVVSQLTANTDLEVIVCLERGGAARVAKIRRLLRGSALAKLRACVAEIPALILFTHAQEIGMFRLQERPKSPQAVLQVDDVNDPELAELVLKTKPDLIFNFGSNIYTPHTLRKLKQPVINLHTGMLPAYRNVHSDFWAFINNDFAGIGVTAFIVDDGIDSGRELLAKRANPRPSDHLWAIKLRNLDLVVSCIVDILSDRGLLAARSHPRISTLSDRGIGKMWPNPSPRDFRKYLRLEISRRRSAKKWGGPVDVG